MEPVYPAVGHRIQVRRKELSWSQADLGRRLNPPVSRAYIWNVEKGEQRLPLHVFVQLCDVLQLDPTALLRGAGENGESLEGARSSKETAVESELAELVAKKLNISPESAAQVLSEQTPRRRRGDHG